MTAPFRISIGVVGYIKCRNVISFGSSPGQDEARELHHSPGYDAHCRPCCSRYRVRGRYSDNLHNPTGYPRCVSKQLQNDIVVSTKHRNMQFHQGLRFDRTVSDDRLPMLTQILYKLRVPLSLKERYARKFLRTTWCVPGSMTTVQPSHSVS